MEPRKRTILHYVDENGVNVFREWLYGLKDDRGRAAILKRLDRVALGLLGDHRYVGHGVWELRIDFGPGYRLYFAEEGVTTVVLFSGGDKSSQASDIRQAHRRCAEYWRRS